MAVTRVRYLCADKMITSEDFMIEQGAIHNRGPERALSCLPIQSGILADVLG